jgi:hypothetical protein
MRVLMNDAVVALITVITAAFSSPPQLPPERLVTPGSWETDDLVAALNPVRDMPDRHFVEAHFDSLPVLTHEGLRFVLPAFMIHSLNFPDSPATERVIFHLSPPDAEQEYWRERIAVFSQPQRAAICRFLNHLRGTTVGHGFEADLERATLVWNCASE